jgi:hypothetical protein
VPGEAIHGSALHSCWHTRVPYPCRSATTTTDACTGRQHVHSLRLGAALMRPHVPIPPRAVQTTLARQASSTSRIRAPAQLRPDGRAPVVAVLSSEKLPLPRGISQNTSFPLVRTEGPSLSRASAIAAANRYRHTASPAVTEPRHEVTMHCRLGTCPLHAEIGRFAHTAPAGLSHNNGPALGQAYPQLHMWWSWCCLT